MPDHGPSSKDVNTHVDVLAQQLVDDVSSHGPIRPRYGRLVPLKTTLEVATKQDTVDVYVVEIPAKSASTILSFLREKLPPVETSIDLQHLRRLVKPEHLPAQFPLATRDVNSQSHEASQATTTNAAPRAGSSLYLVVCPVTVLPLDAIQIILNQHPAFQPPDSPPDIHVLPVPLYAPTSALQAVEWSARLWPTVYKSSNPFGPHPDIFAKAGVEIGKDAGKWMALAHRVGETSRQSGRGEAIGAVVVDDDTETDDIEGTEEPGSTSASKSKVVVVAGDARYLPPFDPSSSSSRSTTLIRKNGNPAAHAVLRAISLVASARLALASPSSPSTNPPKQNPSSNTLSPDQPLTVLESHHHSLTSNGQGGLKPNGYLCLNLTLYITHEPCVMCSMALLHSRFGKVVVGKRMATGGICAEEAIADPSVRGTPYGMWWRRDLNWKMLGWEWVEDRQEDDDEMRQTSVVEKGGDETDVFTSCTVAPDVHV